jgi:hypothetical protein
MSVPSALRASAPVNLGVRPQGIHVVLLTRIPLVLVLLWVILGTAVWWRDLKSPALFFAVALFVGLGAQTVSSVLLAMYKATSNQFIATPAVQAQSAQASDIALQALVTFCVLAPIYWLLSKRL